MDGTVVRLVCKAFTIEAPSITQAVEKWNRVKHSAVHSYEDLEIQSIDKLRLVQAGQTPDYVAQKHAQHVASEVARIKEDWLKKLGVDSFHRERCKIVELSPANAEDGQNRLIYQLWYNDVPYDELTIDLEIMGSMRRSLR